VAQEVASERYVAFALGKKQAFDGFKVHTRMLAPAGVLSQGVLGVKRRISPDVRAALPGRSPHWADVFENAAAERGWARPTMDQFQAEIADGSLYLGSLEPFATKMAAVIRRLGLSRFDLAYSTGRVPHEQKLATIELYGCEVISRVRELLAPAPPAPEGSPSCPLRLSGASPCL
jgi:hypothetical protein